MLETSKDVLYIVLSFCLLWLTAFLCWALFYLTRLLKQTNEMVTELRAKITEITDALLKMKEKLESGFQVVGLMADGLKSVVKYLGKKKND